MADLDPPRHVSNRAFGRVAPPDTLNTEWLTGRLPAGGGSVGIDFGPAFQTWVLTLPTDPTGLPPGSPWRMGDAQSGYIVTFTGLGI